MEPKRAFTLIELLVVIAIIAILAAMLLPVLNKAREKGHSTACLNAIKQYGMSSFLYADDNKGMVPCYTSGRPTYALLVENNYLSLKAQRACPKKELSKSENLADVQWQSYAIWLFWDGNWLYDTDVTGKAWNDDPMESAYVLHKFRKPSRFVLFAESSGMDGGITGQFSCGWCSGQEIHLSHDDRANSFAVDGHAAARTWYQFKHGTDQNFVYFYDVNNNPLEFTYWP